MSWQTVRSQAFKLLVSSVYAEGCLIGTPPAKWCAIRHPGASAAAVAYNSAADNIAAACWAVQMGAAAEAFTFATNLQPKTKAGRPTTHSYPPTCVVLELLLVHVDDVSAHAVQEVLQPGKGRESANESLC